MNASIIGRVASGSTVSFNCYENGDAVAGPYGRSNIWNRLDSGGFVSDAWIFTGSNNPVVPKCQAAPQQQPPKTGKVATTNGTPLMVRNAPSVNAGIVGRLAPGTVITLVCHVQGDSVSGPWGRSTVWNRLENGGFVTDAWVFTGSNNPIVPQCSGPSPAPPQAQVDAFVAKYNGKFVDFDRLYGAQCVDLFQQYGKDVVGTGPLYGFMHASLIYERAPGSVYDKLPANAAPRKGDIAVWNNRTGGGYGHVAIVLQDLGGNGLSVFQQNAPRIGQASNVSNFSKANLIGYLRPKSLG